MMDVQVDLIHKPIDTSKAQIRILHLQPRLGSEPDTITCTLSVVDLDDDDCKYEALSYEWGSPTSTSFSIMLNGRRFPVRENLWWAVRYLRRERDARVMWIDAICIDQDSILERNHQVTQMARIYSQATCVVAWIGRLHQRTPSGKSSNAMEAANFLRHVSEWGQKRQNDTAKKTWSQCIAKCLGEENRSGWDSLLAFSLRSYWNRLWIIQELLLACKVQLQCDHIQITWDDLERAFEHGDFMSWYINRARKLPRSAMLPELDSFQQMQSTVLCKTIQHRNPFSTNILRSSSLFDVIDTYKNAECENPLDKVYGLLGVAPNCCRECLHVNYGQAPSELCKSILRHYLGAHAIEAGLHPTGHSERLRAVLKLFNYKVHTYGAFGCSCRLLNSVMRFLPMDHTAAIVRLKLLGIVLQPGSTHSRKLTVGTFYLRNAYSSDANMRVQAAGITLEILSSPDVFAKRKHASRFAGLRKLLALPSAELSSMAVPEAVRTQVSGFHELVEHGDRLSTYLESASSRYRVQVDPITYEALHGQVRYGDLACRIDGYTTAFLSWDDSSMSVKGITEGFDVTTAYKSPHWLFLDRSSFQERCCQLSSRDDAENVCSFASRQAWNPYV
ncbi:HET-domain-containing protein [Acephala macrosclerotiorum]|nr:HET-domain-containing protein [Acephala macrosclerotiorum]